MDIFEQYFYDLNQFRRMPGNDTTHADMVDILEEKIGVFEVTQNLPLTGNVGNLNVLDRFYRLSSVRRRNIIMESVTRKEFRLFPNVPRFYRLSSVRSGNTIMESVSRKDFRMFPNSPLAAPTAARPIYMIDTINNTIQIAGDDTLTLANIDFIQSPRLVNWTYVVVGGNALYNEMAIDAQNFDLHPSEETELVLKILTLAGFTLKDPNLLQLAAGEDAKNTQQEKQ